MQYSPKPGAGLPGAYVHSLASYARAAIRSAPVNQALAVLQRWAEDLCSIAFLTEDETETSKLPLEEYRRRLSPDMMRAVGAARSLRDVPV
jgi:hypothetical protein